MKGNSKKAKITNKHFLIFESSKGNFIDLDNIGTEDKIVAGQLTVDTKNVDKAMLQISFNCNLKYSLSLTEQLNLLFKLYRRDQNGIVFELTNKSFTVSLYGDLESESEEATVSLQKNEVFYMDYVDEISKGDLYTYIIEVNLIYSSADEASIQSGNITAIGKATKGLC